MRIDEPSENPVIGILERLDALEKQNQLQNASVARGRTRYYAASQLLIEDGNLTVTGTADIFGVLRVVGRVLVEGLGQLVVTSLIDLLGMMRVRGGGGIVIEGGGDIEVNGGEIRVGNVILKEGKILAGGMTIDPDTNGGQIDFGNGRFVNAGSGYLGVYDGDRFVVFNASGITLNAGGRSITVGGAGIRTTGLPTVTETVSGGHKPGAIIQTPDGYLARVVPD